MGWQEFYERRDALDAATGTDGHLTIVTPFTDPDEVLLALQHRWSMRLAGRVELAVTDAERDPAVDLVEAVTEAWHETAEDNPALRQALDTHADRPVLRRALRAEQRMLARAAGLASPAESREEQASVGAAFLTLVRTGGRRPQRRNAVGRLLRRLVPSA